MFLEPEGSVSPGNLLGPTTDLLKAPGDTEITLKCENH